MDAGAAWLVDGDVEAKMGKSDFVDAIPTLGFA